MRQRRESEKRARSGESREKPSQGSVLALEDFVPYRLSLLTNTVSRALADHYSGRFGMSVPEWRVMAVLGRHPHVSAGEVCRRTAMDKVTISRAVGRLDRAGRLVRGADPGDRRRAVLSLSAAGRAVYRRLIPAVRAYESALLAALSEDEAARLDRLLTLLQRRSEALSLRSQPAETLDASAGSA